jgi:hypothetical protein
MSGSGVALVCADEIVANAEQMKTGSRFLIAGILSPEILSPP